jgi:hypothetical protein
MRHSELGSHRIAGCTSNPQAHPQHRWRKRSVRESGSPIHPIASGRRNVQESGALVARARRAEATPLHTAGSSSRRTGSRDGAGGYPFRPAGSRDGATGYSFRPAGSRDGATGYPFRPAGSRDGAAGYPFRRAGSRDGATGYSFGGTRGSNGAAVSSRVTIETDGSGCVSLRSGCRSVGTG